MARGAQRGRGRLSGIEQLPDEASDIIIWARDELQDRSRTQLDIYQDFYRKLEELKRENHGELEFAIPSFSAFNRHSLKLAAHTRDMEETRVIASAAAQRMDPAASDDVTKMAVETVKSIVYGIMVSKRDRVDAKAARELANALKAALQAQNISDALRTRIEARFKEQVETAVDTAVREKGLSSDAAEEIKAKILGVRKQ